LYCLGGYGSALPQAITSPSPPWPPFRCRTW
jgi:hypothetical protein